MQINSIRFMNYYALNCYRGLAKAGETVLVHGASGGVCLIGPISDKLA